jgi:hypothetical protein
MTAANISADHPEPRIGHSILADVFGTGDYEFAAGLLTQLADVPRSGKVATKQELNFILSVLQGHQSQRRDGGPSGSSNGSDPQSTMVAAPPFVPCRDHCPAGQRLEPAEQAFAAQVEAQQRAARPLTDLRVEVVCRRFPL